MPTVNVLKKDLMKALGRDYTEEEFDHLCFEFGIELDDVTSEKKMAIKEKGEEHAQGLSDETIYKIDVPANRYDLLCVEGIARALRIFLEKEAVPVFETIELKDNEVQQLVVKPDTKRVRPFVVSAVLRDVTFTEASYKSFIDLQDKLHQNICRRRTLVAIGTHDLDTIQGPFSYEARKPEDIKFVPLNEEKEFNAVELFDYYRDSKNQRQHLKPYLSIIEDSEVYPVIYDANGVVLSLPPIINGDHSKITLETKNVFIECTATDLTKANIVLNTVVAMFSEHCAKKFTVEQVRVSYEDADFRAPQLLPVLTRTPFSTDIDYINSGIGVELSAERIAELLNKMQLPTKVDADNKKLLHVEAPVTRSDILHAVDIMEDVAIAYGYNKLEKTVPNVKTTGRELPLNKLSELLRQGIAEAGFTEVLTWVLSSQKENFEYLRRKDTGNEAVVLSNPVNTEFDIVRTSLLPGLLKTLGSNKGQVTLPIKLFELSDVVVLAPDTEVGAKNQRRIAALYSGVTSGFEITHGLLDRIMALNDVTFRNDRDAAAKAVAKWEAEEKRRVAAERKKAAKKQKKNKNKKKGEAAAAAAASSASSSSGGNSSDEQKIEEIAAPKELVKTANAKRVYWIEAAKPDENPSFFPGRSAHVFIDGQRVGSFGVFHPEVLSNFGIATPASALELDMEVFL